MFAVIKTGGKQYKVAEKDVLVIEKLKGDAGDSVEFTDVLMVGTEGNLEIGTPLVSGATVHATVVRQTRGRKIVVFKKKRRKNYRRKAGHKQDLTLVEITDILTGGKKPAPKKAEPKAKAKAKPEAKKPAEKKAAPKAKKADDKPAEAAPLFKAPKGDADDLKKISGVGPVLEKKLNALGITTYAQVAAFTKAEIDKVDEVLSFKGRIEREDWLSQAKKLDEDKKTG